MGIKVPQLSFLSVCIYVCLSVCLSICLFVQLSVSKSVNLLLTCIINTLKKNIWQVIHVHLHARTFIYFYFIFLEVLNTPLINSYFLNVIDNHNTKFKELSKNTFPCFKLTLFSFFIQHGIWTLAAIMKMDLICIHLPLGSMHILQVIPFNTLIYSF